MATKQKPQKVAGKVTFKKFNTFKDRGKEAEKATQDYLTEWVRHPYREYNRLVDSKAAGRTIKAAAADFEFFTHADPAMPHFGLIEVKQTEHNYRLERDKVPQLPRLRKRANCGGCCVVLVCHSSLALWRAIDPRWMADNGDKGSWNLTEFPTFTTAGEALRNFVPGVFD